MGIMRAKKFLLFFYFSSLFEIKMKVFLHRTNKNPGKNLFVLYNTHYNDINRYNFFYDINNKNGNSNSDSDTEVLRNSFIMISFDDSLNSFYSTIQ